MVRLIGLTGPIACGKSAVGNFLSQAGLPIIDADITAHKCMRSGQPAYRAVVAAFGDGVLANNGEIDRELLGSIVFGDPDKLRKLNQCTHKYVAMSMLWQLLGLVMMGHGTIVLDIPLLFKFPRIAALTTRVVVVAPFAVQLERLMKRNGLTEGQARAKIGAQMSADEQAKLADVVIDNSGTLEELETAVRKSLHALRRGWPIHPFQRFR